MWLAVIDRNWKITFRFVSFGRQQKALQRRARCEAIARSLRVMQFEIDSRLSPALERLCGERRDNVMKKETMMKRGKKRVTRKCVPKVIRIDTFEA